MLNFERKPKQILDWVEVWVEENPKQVILVFTRTEIARFYTHVALGKVEEKTHGGWKLSGQPNLHVTKFSGENGSNQPQRRWKRDPR